MLSDLIRNIKKIDHLRPANMKTWWNPLSPHSILKELDFPLPYLDVRPDVTGFFCCTKPVYRLGVQRLYGLVTRIDNSRKCLGRLGMSHRYLAISARVSYHLFCWTKAFWQVIPVCYTLREKTKERITMSTSFHFTTEISGHFHRRSNKKRRKK